MKLSDSTKIAALRAFITASVVGAQSAVVVASQTNDEKTIFLAAAGSFLSVMAMRLGVEGYQDRPK